MSGSNRSTDYTGGTAVMINLEIPTFDSSQVSSNFDKWYHDAMDDFVAMNVRDPRQQVAILTRQLTGHAGIIRDEYKRDRRQGKAQVLNTPEEFYQYFRPLFVNKGFVVRPKDMRASLMVLRVSTACLCMRTSTSHRATSSG